MEHKTSIGQSHPEALFLSVPELAARWDKDKRTIRKFVKRLPGIYNPGKHRHFLIPRELVLKIERGEM